MLNDQISINNLSKVYDNGFEALKKINLNIKKGEIFAMLGPNGAGKTTLLIFKDNKEVYRSIGETTKELLYDALKSSI